MRSGRRLPESKLPSFRHLSLAHVTFCRSQIDPRRSLDPAQDEVPRRRVHEVDVAAAEAAGQEDAVGALDEVGELLLGDAAADDAVVRLVALADPSPIERPVDEIGAEDDADVVEFEALRGVDAADLLDPPRVARPEVGLRDAGRQAADAVAWAFQGIDQSPTLTSGSSWPASSGSDQGQQKPATRRAVAPSPALPRMSVSSSLTEPTTRKSNSSSAGQRTCGVRSSSSVLSTHLMNESEPFERNWAWSSNSRTSSERLAAASRIRSVLPTSPGRTTCRSSMKKTVTRGWRRGCRRSGPCPCAPSRA